jgi:hypothetical protein
VSDGPLLGLATTEELFREIIARFTTTGLSDTSVIFHATGTTHLNVNRALLLAEMLGGLNALDREYRTAEPREQEPDPIAPRDSHAHAHQWVDIPPLTSQLCSCGATRRDEL